MSSNDVDSIRRCILFLLGFARSLSTECFQQEAIILAWATLGLKARCWARGKQKLSEAGNARPAKLQSGRVTPPKRRIVFTRFFLRTIPGTKIFKYYAFRLFFRAFAWAFRLSRTSLKIAKSVSLFEWRSTQVEFQVEFTQSSERLHSGSSRLRNVPYFSWRSPSWAGKLSWSLVDLLFQINEIVKGGPLRSKNQMSSIEWSPFWSHRKPSGVGAKQVGQLTN